MELTMNRFCIVALCLLSLVKTGLSLRCLECNVWKAGYGHLCDNPLIRDDCLACMKTETTVFMGYYKDTPRSSTIISRICVKTKVPEFGDECHFYDMAGGINIECYCNSDECNTSDRSHHSLLTIVTALVFGVIALCHLL